MGSLKIAVNEMGVVLVGSAWAVTKGSDADPWLTVTVGAALSILTVLLPDDPGFPAASVWLAAKMYVPSADSGVVSVSVQLPAVQEVLDGDVGLPPSVTITEPSPVEHEPPTEVTFWFVVYGKVTELPFTVSSVTV